MSISSAVQKAIRIAKVNLGDIVRTGQYLRRVSSQYDVATGDHLDTTETVNIQWAPDKFSYTELESGMYLEKDVKIMVFNDNNDLNFNMDESIVIDGQTYSVFKAFPTKVGSFTPIWSLVLRQ